MKYTETHDWIDHETDRVTVGITSQAQQELGEIVYVELPEIERFAQAGEQVVVLESTKAAIDIYAPLSGKIVAVNEALRSSPEKINEEPEVGGWLYKIEPTEPVEFNDLLDKTSYEALLS